MSLSILIPTYNYVCLSLATSLKSQAETIHNLKWEIIVADDGSTNRATVAENAQIETMENCRFLAFSQNMGRAAIRNELARNARYENILFIDSDAEVCSENFIKAYLEAATLHEVVCGGIRNMEKLPSADVTLRYRYEQSACNVRTLAYRSNYPYKYFTTFNFLIKRELFLSILFDEQCHEYGYEDALFGITLQKNCIKIKHIDNPLVHTGMDTNYSFLKKTEKALHTLYALGDKMQASAFVSRTAHRLRKLHLAWLVLLFHFLFSPLLRLQLLSHHPSILLLQIYKLGYFIKISKK